MSKLMQAFANPRLPRDLDGALNDRLANWGYVPVGNRRQGIEMAIAEATDGASTGALFYQRTDNPMLHAVVVCEDPKEGVKSTDTVYFVAEGGRCDAGADGCYPAGVYSQKSVRDMVKPNLVMRGLSALLTAYCPRCAMAS